MRVEAARLAKFEVDCLRKFDACVLVSEADKLFVEQSAAVGLERSRLKVIPLGVNATLGGVIPDLLYCPPVLVFIGKMNYQPNVQAVLFFASQVLPLIANAIPEVQLRIIGGDPVKQVQVLAEDPRVTVTGWVEDIRSELSHACMSVAPMVSGTGMQTKILESMMFGLPVVTTPLGAASLDFQHGQEILVAEGAHALALSIIGLLLDRPELKRLAHAGQVAVNRRYSSAEVMRNYTNIINGEL
jgi:glycosyltransferase involved in cell wall biosynthesis